jgi:hypothetical protein
MVEPWGRNDEEYQHEVHSLDRGRTEESGIAGISWPRQLLDGPYPAKNSNFIAPEAPLPISPEIRVNIESRISSSVSPRSKKPNYLIGAVAVALALAGVGWATSSKLIPTPAPVIQAGATQNSVSTAAKSDREETKIAPSEFTAKAEPVPTDTIAALLNREHVRSEPAGRSLKPRPAPRLPPSDRVDVPQKPVPETKPTTIDGWSVRNVHRSTAVLAGPTGVWTVTRGDNVPGVGTINSIVRWGDRWLVATSRGLISSP